MATTIRDVSQLQGRPEYDTAILTPLLVLMVNNGFVGEEVFNIVQSLDNISYSVETFNDKFSFTTWIEQYYDHMSTDSLGDMKYVGSIYYIGADISVKSYFGIRPYLMYDMREIQSIKSVSLGAWLWGKLF